MSKEEGEEEQYKEVLRAVKSGDNKAKTRLAWYKLSGCGGAEIDEDGAVVLLEECVKENDAEAIWMLGLCCEYGIGCEQDLERAETVYEQSWEGGNVIGNFFAATGRYERGSGVLEGLQ